MPGVIQRCFNNPNIAHYNRYFLSIYDTEKYKDYKFIFLSAIPRFVKSFYKYYGLNYLQLTNIDLLYEYPEQVLVEDLSIFNKITRYQTADYFRQVRDNVFYKRDTAKYFHASGAYMEYTIEAIQIGKQSDYREIDEAQGVYKICKDCYKDGFFYRDLCKDMSGINGNLAQIEELSTIVDVHVVHSNLDGLLSYLMYGNYLYDYSEIKNVYHAMYLYCNHCNRSVLDNFTCIETDDELGEECMRCFIDLIWDEDTDINELIDFHKFATIDKDRREEYGFPINNMYQRWANRQKVTRRLSFSDETEWLDCKKPKYQVERLGLLAARAAAKVLDE